MKRKESQLTHNFEKSRAVGTTFCDGDEAKTLEMYKRAFPKMTRRIVYGGTTYQNRKLHTDVRVFGDGNKIIANVDEKVRRQNYNDFCAEIFSDYDRRSPSWLTSDDAETTHILYNVLPIRAVYVLPYKKLHTWAKDVMASIARDGLPSKIAVDREWGAEVRKAKNDGWTTINCFISWLCVCRIISPDPMVMFSY